MILSMKKRRQIGVRGTCTRSGTNLLKIIWLPCIYNELLMIILTTKQLYSTSIPCHIPGNYYILHVFFFIGIPVKIRATLVQFTGLNAVIEKFGSSIILSQCNQHKRYVIVITVSRLHIDFSGTAEIDILGGNRGI